MALVDYGVVVKRNGKILNTDKFLTMKETLGFEVNKSIPCKMYDDEYYLNPVEDYTGWAGDKNYFIGFYKCTAQLFSRTEEGYECKFITGENVDAICTQHYCDENNQDYHYSWYWVAESKNRKMLTLHTPDTKWEILYGYGIDQDYKTQLNCAFEYGLSIDEIEQIAEFHGHILYVNGIKCKFHRKDNRLKRKYTYKELKGHYAIGVLYDDDDKWCRMAKEWRYTQKELPKLMEDLDNLPPEIKRFIASLSITEPVIHLYATYYHRIVNTDQCSTYNGTNYTDSHIYYKKYTRKEINNWED